VTPTREPAEAGSPPPGPEGVEDDGLEETGDGGPAVGDLVVIPVPRIRAQVGCGERVGVVLEDRRHVVKVFFPEIDRAFWVERAAVASVAEGRLPAAPLAVRLHRVASLLSAVAIEVYDREGDADVFHVYSRGTDLEALLRVREYLGPDLRRVSIEPGGVRRARVTVVFRTA
jgi:hypothetical protein